MPNIMLTYRCNLKCPYCFANDFVGTSSEDITLENFDKAVEFLTRNEPIHLGLIGGEPTVHPQFGTILQRIIDNPRIFLATVYTNGIRLAGYEELLSHPKISLLVNWNSPTDIGEKAFDSIRNNVDKLIFERGMKHRLNLGLNLYGESFNYGYMLDLLKRYDLHKVRISLTVPTFPLEKDIDVLEYFKSFKPSLLKMFHDMDAIDVLPYYDCNRPPYCIWTEEEKTWLESFAARFNDPDCSITNTQSFCRPVVDVLPNLNAVRCFGMSFFGQTPLSDHPSLEDLTAHFMREIDRRAFRLNAAEQCDVCPPRRQWLCCQGCMGFKANGINRLIAEGK